MTTLNFTEDQFQKLYAHLYPGDGKEAGAILLCGNARSAVNKRLIVHKVCLIEYGDSVRAENLLEWNTEVIVPFLDEAAKTGLSVVKVHSHPGGLRAFSRQDDKADRELFPEVYEWVGRDVSHFSAVVMSNREVIFREVSRDGQFTPLFRVVVHGERITINEREKVLETDESNIRQIQTFGRGTINKLKNLRVGLVGCSGTGSCIAEALRKNAVGEIVWVDPKTVGIKNLNRILGAEMKDALQKLPKVDLMQRLTDSLSFGTKSICLESELTKLETLLELCTCDVIFGCVDSVTGRHLLNLFCTYFSIPFFDVGVGINADGEGGLESAIAGFHYVQPGKSTLLSRGLYSSSAITAEDLKKTDPIEYSKQIGEGYIKGVVEDRPAVYAINSIASALAFEDFLARLHGYREVDVVSAAHRRYSLTHSEVFDEVESEFEEYLPWKGLVGLGDVFFRQESRRFSGAWPAISVIDLPKLPTQ